MKNINVDIRFADGRIFQCPMPTISEAKDLAQRLNEGAADMTARPSGRITGIMVTRWNGSDTQTVVTYGAAFIY